MDKKTKRTVAIVIALLLLIGVSTFLAIRVVAPNEKKPDVTEAQDSKLQEAAADTGMQKQNTPEKENNKTETVAQSQAKPQATTQAQGTMQADKPDTTEQGGTTQQTVAEKPDEPATEQPKPQTPSTQPQTPETTEAPAQPQAPPATTEQVTTEQATAEPVAVWVVDQPAWDEEVPIYEQRCRMVCASCGGYMYSVEDIEAHPCISSRYDDFYNVQVGTETIHHDEIGHWEYQ